VLFVLFVVKPLGFRLAADVPESYGTRDTTKDSKSTKGFGKEMDGQSSSFPGRLFNGGQEDEDDRNGPIERFGRRRTDAGSRTFWLAGPAHSG